jgi:hypothetical protein
VETKKVSKAYSQLWRGYAVFWSIKCIFEIAVSVQEKLAKNLRMNFTKNDVSWKQMTMQFNIQSSTEKCGLKD